MISWRGTPDAELALAQQVRLDALLDEELDKRLDVLLSAATVTPVARSQLQELLKHYAKNPHPFRACTRDNMKRFGPGRTERVCATVVDLIKGTTHWRKGGGGVHASLPEVSPEVEQILLSIPPGEIERVIIEVAR